MNQKQTNNSRLDLKKFIVNWNKNFPIDYLWRQKYGVAFGSPEHRQMSFLDMMFDFEEERMMKRIFGPPQEKKSDKIENIISDDDFENIDISQFNNKEE
jgi:hypothetical protein